MVVTSGNVQQHRDLHRGPRRRGRAQPQRDAHLPVRQRQRQGRRGGPQGLQTRQIQVKYFLFNCTNIFFYVKVVSSKSKNIEYFVKVSKQ